MQTTSRANAANSISSFYKATLNTPTIRVPDVCQFLSAQVNLKSSNLARVLRDINPKIVQLSMRKMLIIFTLIIVSRYYLNLLYNFSLLGKTQVVTKNIFWLICWFRIKNIATYILVFSYWFHCKVKLRIGKLLSVTNPGLMKLA